MSAEDLGHLDPEAFVDLLPKPGEEAFEELELCLEYEKAFAERKKHPRRELPFGTDAHDLEQTGWGVIFARNLNPLVREQLRPLLTRRKRQAGKRYKTFELSRKDSGRSFLHKLGEAPGVIEPSRIPYYLLLVGGPKEIPFEFQYQLARSHAVGRIAFDDLADYGSYARAVVAAEELPGTGLRRRASLFSVKNDPTTRLLTRHLTTPLKKCWKKIAPKWEKLELLHSKKASKNALKRLLKNDVPAVFLVSAHGTRLKPGNLAKQKRVQGAIRCQNKDERFTAEDVPKNIRLDGRLAFLFPCYGAGTPIIDDFPEDPTARGAIIAQEPFVAALPQALLARGALAVVGHVDRGWTLSFSWGATKDGKAVTAANSLMDVLRRLFQGERLGHAMRPLQLRAMELAADLAEAIRDQEDSVRQWHAYLDARNFIVLGDPAVYALGKARRDSHRVIGKRRREHNQVPRRQPTEKE